MSNTNYRKLSATGTKAVFIAPTNALNRLTLQTLANPKKVSGISLLNRRVEIKVTRSVDPRGSDCKDCTPIKEPLSVTLVISGSTTETALKELAFMKEDVKIAVDAAWNDLVVVGAPPESNSGLIYHASPST